LTPGLNVTVTIFAKPLGLDQLILVNKAVNEKDQLEKGLEEEKIQINLGANKYVSIPITLHRYALAEIRTHDLLFQMRRR
jgi:hypothetical protein